MKWAHGSQTGQGYDPEMSRNSITTESADAQCVGVPVLGPTSGRAFAFSDGQTPSMNVMNLMVVSLAGWMNQQQQDVIEYLREEVRVLKELQGKKRLRFTDEQRRRLARKAKRIRFDRLKEVVGVVTPQTLLAWHRKLIANSSR